MEKKIVLVLSVVVAILLNIQVVYSICSGTFYCDNTDPEKTRECPLTVGGTYNGSFAGSASYHNWSITVTGVRVNFTASIAGEADDNLNLRVYTPTGNILDSAGPGSSKSLSTCSVGGTYKSEVEAFTVPDGCAPYNITISAFNVTCCQSSDCNDGLACSLDTCSNGACFYCTQSGYNVSTCNNYPCCPGLQECFDGVCRATCPDFSISLDPTSLSITVPQSGYNASKSTINITSINSFNSQVTFSGSWIGSQPSGVTYSFSPSSVTPPANGSAYANVTVNVSSTASTGTYTLRVTATSGLLSKYADLTVTILPSPAAPFDFNVSVSPSSGSVVQGSWVNTTVTVTLISGSSQTVTLSASGLPTDATYTFLPSNSGNPTYSRTLNISTKYSTPNGTYSITVSGTGGGLTRSATYTLTVNPSPVCVRANPVVSISPTYGYGKAGETLTYTVTVTNKDSTACGESTFSLQGIMPSGQNFSYSFSQPTLVIKPVGFNNQNSSYFYVTSNCTSKESTSHTIRANVTNLNDPKYFSTASAYYYVYDHFSASFSTSLSGVSGSSGSASVYVYNNRYSTCPASTFSLVGLSDSVPSGWSYVLGPSSVTLSPGSSSTSMRMNVFTPCNAAPGSYQIKVNVSDSLTNVQKTISTTYSIASPSSSLRANPFFSVGPFSSTLIATFSNLNTTCFPTATLDCGNGHTINVPISGNTATTTCSYPPVAVTTYYTTRVNVSANADIVSQTTVVDNPSDFNFTVSVSPGVATSSGLVGFWPFDEGWGISTADKSGYNHNGSLGVTNWEYVPSWTLGKFGYGLGFDGSNDYVRISNVGVNASAGAYNTVSFWMYWNGVENQMPMGWQQAYDLWFYGGCFGFNTGQNNVLGISSAGLANRWVHVVAIFYNGVPSPTTASLYIDGIKQNIFACYGSTTYSRSVTSTIQISGWAFGSGYYFGGVIDEFKVWNRALSDEEVLAEYQLSKVAQGQKHFANISTTLLTGSSQPVTISLTGCPPNAECTLIPNVSNPTYASVLTVSASSSTPTGNYTLTITGTNGTLTRSMNYTIEVTGVCTRSNPYITISQASPAVAGQELSYSIYLTNKDSSACPPSIFSLELFPLFDADGWKFDKANWLSGWQYRETIAIDNTQNPNTLTDYQVLVTIDTASLISAGKMRADCGDVRFTDSDGTLINYWLESGCNSANTKLWVKVPSIPASSTKTIYVYYGNPSASSASNGTNTFVFFDDFEYTDSPTNHGWSWVGGSVTATTSTATAQCGTRSLRLEGATGGNPVLYHSIGAWTTPLIAEYYSRHDVTNTHFSTMDFYGGAGATATWAENQRIYHHFRNNGYLTWYDTAYHDYMSYSANTWYKFKVIVKPSAQKYDIYVNDVLKVSDANFRVAGTDITQVAFTDNMAGYQDCVRIRKYTSPEPTVKVGITLNPGETRTINLNVTSPSSAAVGTYKFNLIASSGTYSNSTSGEYKITGLCPPPSCYIAGDCIPEGMCWGHQQVCKNGQVQNSCGDYVCNCGESETDCENDCAGVYYMLWRDWHLISIPYKNVLNITADTCGADKLHFFYYENYSWKKVVGISNIKGGYGYWTNPSWFTKSEYCYINVTVSKLESISLEELPKLKKGFNAIGAPITPVMLQDLKCLDDLGNQVPIRGVYYWYPRDKEWRLLNSTDYLNSTRPYYYGYWTYVDNDCKLTK